jgi:hypothetical protein
MVANSDPPCVGSSQAGNAIKQRGLPRPAWAENDRDPRGDGESEVEGEIAPGIGKVFAKLHR